ncbi:Leucine-rich repeat-containing protein 27 [Trichoplax sp. H2]|nr:Leucine-rich repeat-containing protein 27 [Trichoplax sp. H2]|eukprot:RDD42713.1 Leucine-rich repeat-containing protein 27 [Trichoplax sp. H2]
MAAVNGDHIQYLIQKCKVDGSISIDLSQMNITRISDELLSLDHIEQLYLEGNKLLALPDDFFDRLPSLRWLDLRNNQLQSIPSSIGNHKTLTNLLLSGNLLTELPVELGNLTTMEGINFNNNPLSFPPTEIQQQGIQGILQYMKEMLREKQKTQETTTDNEQDEEQNVPSLPLGLDHSDGKAEDEITENSDKMTDFEAIAENLTFGIGQLMHQSGNGYGSTNSNSKSDSSQGKPINIKHSSAGRTKSNPMVGEKQVTINKIQKKIKEDEHSWMQKRDNQQREHELQKLKSKNTLRDWRQEGKRLQRNKQMAAAMNPEATKASVSPPYGIHDNPTRVDNTQQEAEAKPATKKSLLSKLEDRIKSHTIHLNRKFGQHQSASEELAEAERNLNIAQQHQRELQKVKAADDEFMAYNPVA